jgi:hypothetical protein
MKESEKNIKEDLAVWFGTKKKSKGSKQPKGPWVNICRKNKDGKHPPCGRSDSDGDGKKDGAYPKCRAVHVAAKMSEKEKQSACRQKRRAEKKEPKTGKGNTPTMTSHKKTNESMDKKIFKLTEKELYTIVENVINEQKEKLSKYETVDDMAEWSEIVSQNSADDFGFVYTDRFRVAVDGDNEYIAHFDYKTGKGFFDEMDLLPSSVLEELGITVDDEEYDYVDGLTESELIEGKKKGKNKKKKKKDTTLCARGKSAAKAKFDVYPSAYANGYAVQVCKGKIKGLDGKKRCSGKFCKGRGKS